MRLGVAAGRRHCLVAAALLAVRATLKGRVEIPLRRMDVALCRRRVAVNITSCACMWEDWWWGWEVRTIAERASSLHHHHRLHLILQYLCTLYVFLERNNVTISCPIISRCTTMKLAALLLLPPLLRQAIAHTTLSDSSLRALLPATDADFNIHTGRLLAPILQPRVPGTPGSAAVLAHFVNYFTTHLPDWDLTFQNSTSTTPTSHGKDVPFINLIATRDPPWLNGQQGEVARQALVAHYDSKLTPTGFIGATDSAAPCAMLLHVAQSLDAALTRKWTAMAAEGLGAGGYGGVKDHKGLQIILLDGEEAFQTWTHTDSLYGARALAEEWEGTVNSAMSTFQSPLDSIELFVLLDLLGSANPIVPSYFKTTHWAYQLLADVEQRLRGLSSGGPAVLTTNPNRPFLPEANKGESNANERWLGGYIEDDHLPFMARGVEILHLIPSPFPHVWHTMQDDGEHLDIATVRDWAAITAAFAAEWMDLEGFLENGQSERASKRSWEDEKTEL